MIYNCTNSGNNCDKRDTCVRFLANQEPQTTLYKAMCTKENNYILYIKAEIYEGDGDSEQEQN